MLVTVKTSNFNIILILTLAVFSTRLACNSLHFSSVSAHEVVFFIYLTETPAGRGAERFRMSVCAVSEC